MRNGRWGMQLIKEKYKAGHRDGHVIYCSTCTQKPWHWAVLETEIINKYPTVALQLFFFLPPYFSVSLLPAFHQFLFFALAVVLWLCVSASQIPSNSFSQFFIWLCIQTLDFRLTLQVKLICFNGLTRHSNLVVEEGVKCSFYRAHMPQSHTYPWAQPAFLAKQIFSLLRSAYCFRGVYDLLSDIFSYCIT